MNIMHIINRFFSNNSFDIVMEPYVGQLPRLIELPKTASGETIYRWERLNTDAVIWTFIKNETVRHDISIKPLLSILKTKTIDEYSVDIREIERLSASKSRLDESPDLDSFIIKNRPTMVNDVNHDNLKKYLSHKEIRIIHNKNAGDRLVKMSWCNELLLCNSGGSHNFAAARYMAKQLNVPIKITGQLLSHHFSDADINALTSKYYVFLTPKHDVFYGDLIDYFRKIKQGFIYLKTLTVTHIPGNFLLIENTSNNQKVIYELLKFGFQDVGSYLMEMSKKQ
jgi:hypothetical protein